jgi:hypothetical protein
MPFPSFRQMPGPKKNRSFYFTDCHKNDILDNFFLEIVKLNKLSQAKTIPGF